MPDTDTQVRPFADFLLELSGGTTHAELSEQLKELVEAVQDTGRAGSLTLQIKVAKLDKKGDALTVTDVVACKPPKGDRPTSIFFADAAGNLSRRDPRQMEFEALREVPAPAVAEPLREVAK